MSPFFAAWLMLAAPAAAGSAEPATATPVASAQPLVLRVAPEDFAQLREAIETRLPSVAVQPHRAAVLEALRGRDLLYAELAPSATAGELRLVIILRDGRSFERTFAVDETDRLHSIATTIANTIAAIREESIAPTSTDVAIPAADPEPATAPATVPPPLPSSAPTEDERSAPPTILGLHSAPRRIELGLSAWAAPLVGLGPHDVAPPQGTTGLDVDLRLPKGALVGVGGRYGTRGKHDVRVHRIAVTLVGGYDLRRRDFELRMAAGLVLEPWLVRASSTSRTPRDDAGRKGGPLVGAIVGLAPGWYWRRHVGSAVALRLGMRAQLQLASLGSGGMARVRYVRDAAPVEVARLGGAEVILGIDATMWITLRKRS